ncbi:hypothetical protein TU12-16_00085 [Vibrio phage ICP2_2006_A]|uniref:Uncharacterized protein n=2 Tax=Icepovirus bengalense TaxID=2846603 RepID=F1D0X7_9CAUD|nr:hypothetical protein ViPhICP2p18 [Vibrio phage ICP2]ADX87700.1 conserved hypothetical protein [Vibrio phage ICP2]ADX87771.1 hypothetical protein TU12-16_00085 [Vibrio phage ICP2_2006_A]QNL29728.1 hypothetical protein Saratov15_00048 [Vibrio phage Saratov-15]
MKTVWTQGMKGEQKEQFANDFAGSKVVRDRLVEILRQRIAENREQQIKMDGFDCPNWGFKQAAYNSKEKTLLEVIDLLL